MSERKPLVTTPREFHARTASPDRRLLVVSLGGTIIQYPDPDPDPAKNGLLIPHPEPLTLFRERTTIQNEADLNFRLVANIDSTNMKSRYWVETAKVIAEEQDHYDGILVTHGTDTMAHTAAALRFLLGDRLRVPVVLTGSQMPLVAGSRSDASPNLGDSVQTLIAARDAEVNEVMVVFGHRVLRGNRSNKESEVDFAAFRSPAFPELAVLNAGPADFRKSVLASRADLSGIKEDDALPPIEITDGFAEPPLEIAMNPDFKLKQRLIDSLVDYEYPGVIMRSFGAGNIPDNILDSIRLLTDYGVPVLIGASHPGAGMNADYAVGQAPIDAGAIKTGNMLSHVALIKLRMLHYRGLRLPQMREEMPRSYYGEVG